MKTLNTRERKRRKLLSMHKSLSNKMSIENIIWWNGLSLTAQYSLLFRWITYKSIHKKVKLKHFTNIYKARYTPSKSNNRTSTINYILNEN